MNDIGWGWGGYEGCSLGNHHLHNQVAVVVRGLLHDVVLHGEALLAHKRICEGVGAGL